MPLKSKLKKKYFSFNKFYNNKNFLEFNKKKKIKISKIYNRVIFIILWVVNLWLIKKYILFIEI